MSRVVLRQGNKSTNTLVFESFCNIAQSCHCHYPYSGWESWEKTKSWKLTSWLIAKKGYRCFVAKAAISLFRRGYTTFLQATALTSFRTNVRFLTTFILNIHTLAAFSKKYASLRTLALAVVFNPIQSHALRPLNGKTKGSVPNELYHHHRYISVRKGTF